MPRFQLEFWHVEIRFTENFQYLRGDGMGWDVCRVTCDVLQDPVQLYQKRTRDFDGDADKASSRSV